MRSLSGLDATFLYLETPETPMHVGSLHLCELPKGFKGSFRAAVQAHLRKRMHLAPLFSQRLAFPPMNLGHPLWVDAGDVDLDFHVRRAKGGALTVRQVEAAAARLHAQLIDRARPLWEFHVFEEVKPAAGMAVQGRLAAFYSKIHHAALDGKGGTVLANAILDLDPVPREVPPPRTPLRPADLKVGQMVGAVFSNSMAQIAKLARALPATASSLCAAATRGGSPLQLAPRTVFNVGIGTGRSFATASLPMADCRALARSVGGSLNDVVLWLCSTALRSYLHKHASVPRRSLVAAMPVSLRDDGNTDLNNQASITAVQLGSQFADPLRRMSAIMDSTGKVKQALGQLKSVLPTDYPSLLAPWLVGGAGRMLLKTYGRGSIAQRLPAVANLAISNVPGPPVPMYLAGARLLTFHPLSIVLHGLALNITVQSYAGRIDFGLVADSKAVPRLGELAKALETAFEEAQRAFPEPLRKAA